jgi:hypothetical protein
MTHPAQQHDLPPDDERDPLLDAFLAEALGGQSPPDLAARVLRALGPASAAAGVNGNGHGIAGNGHGMAAAQVAASSASAERNGVPAPPVAAPAPLALNGTHSRSVRRRRHGSWTQWMIAAGVVAGCAMAVWIAFSPGGPTTSEGGAPHDKSAPSVAGSKGQKDNSQPAESDIRPNQVVDADGYPEGYPDERPARQGEPPQAVTNRRDPAPRAPQPSAVAEAAPRPAPRAPRPAARSTDDEVIASIDRAIRQRWAAATVTPSARATDAEWLRRTYLSVLGRIPKLHELEAFLADSSSTRRAATVDRLLNSDLYAEEFARNWTNVYTEALLGHTVGDMPSDKTDRDGMRQFLRRSFLDNKPYDVLTGELLTATGSTRPGEADFNGATNFLADRLDHDGVQATVKTAEIFLGVQVQCTQCHNHPFNDWKQGRFWELNAFFRQATVDGDSDVAADGNENQRGDENGPVRIADADFYGDGAASDEDAEIYYEERNGRLKAAYPVFFDGTAISRNGEIEKVNRRRELARLVTASPWFAEAAVNRMWSHFFGHGFTRPIDDMGPHNPPSHPELLDRLAREFTARDYDLKPLIRWIVLSEPYALSSRPSRDNHHDDPTAGDPPLFSRYYLRQMRAEQLYESLAAATGEMHPARGGQGDSPPPGSNTPPPGSNAPRSDIDAAYAHREQEKADWMRQFVIAYRTDECDECSLFVGSIPQTLAMMNGELVAGATSSESPGLLAEIARSPTTEGTKIRQLFLAALARNPSPGEQTAARRLLSMHGNDTPAALEDLWWALLNSNEFILDR